MKKSVSPKLGVFIFVATLFCSSSTQAQTKQYVLHISADPDTFSEKVINRQ